MLRVTVTLLALAALVSATPTSLSPARDQYRTLVTTTTPAAACSSAAPFACAPGDAFCCAESTQCVALATATKWACRVTDRLDNALACGASDTACADGVTCCPEDMACAPGGGCVGTDIDLGSDDAGDEDPDDGLEQCEDGEVLCADACCTEAEACDAQTGMCVSLEGRPPQDVPIGKNATTAGALLSGKNETVPNALGAHKNVTAAKSANETAAVLGVSNAAQAEIRAWGVSVVAGSVLAVVVARAVRAVHGY